MGSAVVIPSATVRLAWLRPCFLVYLATLAGLLLLAGAVAAVAAVRDLTHVVVPFDWHHAPHDASGHNATTALSLWLHNARLALAPLAGAAAVQRNARRLRQAGDVLFGFLLAINVVPLAVDLGTWGSRLLPYIPNAPIELLGFIVGPVTWWLVTRGRIPVRSLWLIAAVVVVLLLAAACLETWAVP